MDLFRAELDLANFEPDVRIIENKSHSKIIDIEHEWTVQSNAWIHYYWFHFKIKNSHLTEYEIALEFYQHKNI